MAMPPGTPGWDYDPRELADWHRCEGCGRHDCRCHICHDNPSAGGCGACGEGLDAYRNWEHALEQDGMAALGALSQLSRTLRDPDHGDDATKLLADVVDTFVKMELNPFFCAPEEK